MRVITIEYRHEQSPPVERAKVIAEVESAWIQVQSLAVPVDLNVNEEVTNAAMTRFKTQALDGIPNLIRSPPFHRSEVGHMMDKSGISELLCLNKV